MKAPYEFLDDCINPYKPMSPILCGLREMLSINDNKIKKSHLNTLNESGPIQMTR